MSVRIRLFACVALLVAFVVALAGCGAAPPERRLELTVTAAGYEPARLEAKVGEMVIIQFRNRDRVAHSLVVDLPAGPRMISATDGVDAVISFTVPEAGEYRLSCQVPGHTEEGVLVVTE